MDEETGVRATKKPTNRPKVFCIVFILIAVIIGIVVLILLLHSAQRNKGKIMANHYEALVDQLDL